MTTDNLYFIQNGNGQKIGPIAVEQLVQDEITPRTLVWRQGLEDWKEARLLPELDFLWQNSSPNAGSDTPPFQAPPRQHPFTPQSNTPYNSYTNGDIPPKCPPNYLAFAIISAILGTIFLFPFGMIFGVIAIVKASSVEKIHRQGDFSEAERYSKAARTWSLVNIIVLIGFILIGLTIAILSAIFR